TRLAKPQMNIIGVQRTLQFTEKDIVITAPLNVAGEDVPITIHSNTDTKKPQKDQGWYLGIILFPYNIAPTGMGRTWSQVLSEAALSQFSFLKSNVLRLFKGSVAANVINNQVISGACQEELAGGNVKMLWTEEHDKYTLQLQDSQSGRNMGVKVQMQAVQNAWTYMDEEKDEGETRFAGLCIPPSNGGLENSSSKRPGPQWSPWVVINRKQMALHDVIIICI
ncbi:hypothetical protein HF521_021490, partial [Silurus meridionalis]